MSLDSARLCRVTSALRECGYDAVVCTTPEDVLILSGYWPVIGNAVAVVTEEGACAVVAPKDELKFVRSGWADSVFPFEAGSLDAIESPEDVVAPPLFEALGRLGLSRQSIVALQDGPSMTPSGYAARFAYGPALGRLLAHRVQVQDATSMLQRLRCLLTDAEVENVRAACATAKAAFVHTVPFVVSGVTENALAVRLRSGLLRSDSDVRADGFAYCMSGPNAAHAWAAFQHSTDRTVEPGDLVLLHCNSFHNGFWTDITRTYCAGEPNSDAQYMYDAVFEARAAALAAVGPGVPACAVDTAARTVLTNHGFGEAFRHPTGHGVGFVAANHNALPRIHPCAREPLEPGMVFNIEPGIYLEGLCGMRHCDMVVVTDNGCELLTPFHTGSP